jgi:hypothetical protein
MERPNLRIAPTPEETKHKNELAEQVACLVVPAVREIQKQALDIINASPVDEKIKWRAAQGTARAIIVTALLPMVEMSAKHGVGNAVIDMAELTASSMDAVMQILEKQGDI